MIFLPARPASQTHDSHKGRMILNHVNPAGRIKNCGEKSAFKNLQLSFFNVFLLAHRVLNNIGKNRSVVPRSRFLGDTGVPLPEFQGDI